MKIKTPRQHALEAILTCAGIIAMGLAVVGANLGINSLVQWIINHAG